MRILVTGASGWIGSAVVPELLGAGHQVIGLARSDQSAEKILGLGAEVVRGSIDDADSLERAVADTDGVVHLGYNHDFSQMAQAAETDRNAVETFAHGLAGTGRFLAIASGVVGLSTDGMATERDRPDPNSHPRSATQRLVLDLADREIRSIVLRFPPTVHGPGDHGFMATLSGLATRTGYAGYIGDGANRWPAVHRLDAAVAVRLGVETAPPASILHVIAEEGVPTRTIAEALGDSLGVPAQSVASEQAEGHFGWLGRFFGADVAASSALTRELLTWTPTHPGLIEDIEAGSYVDADPDSPA